MGRSGNNIQLKYTFYLRTKTRVLFDLFSKSLKRRDPPSCVVPAPSQANTVSADPFIVFTKGMEDLPHGGVTTGMERNGIPAVRYEDLERVSPSFWSLIPSLVHSSRTRGSSGVADNMLFA